MHGLDTLLPQHQTFFDILSIATQLNFVELVQKWLLAGIQNVVLFSSFQAATKCQCKIYIDCVLNSVLYVHIAPHRSLFRFLPPLTVKVRTSLTSLRALQVSTVFQRDGSKSSQQGNSHWAAAAAGVAAVLGSGAMVSLCETEHYHKSIKDPNTIYAKHALKRLSEEQSKIAAAGPAQEVAQTQEQSATKVNPVVDATVMEEKPAPAPRATLQATSKTVQKVSEPQEEVREENNKPQATSSAVDTSLAPAQPVTPMTDEEVRIEEKTRKAKQHSGGLKIFSGNGNMSLALEIAKNLGINLGKATVGRFADGECNVCIHENVRGKDVYVIQPTCTPVNDNLMELLLMVSTLRRASARRITVVIPYYGYARQDRKMQVCLPKYLELIICLSMSVLQNVFSIMLTFFFLLR